MAALSVDWRVLLQVGLTADWMVVWMVSLSVAPLVSQLVVMMDEVKADTWGEPKVDYLADGMVEWMAGSWDYCLVDSLVATKALTLGVKKAALLAAL